MTAYDADSDANGEVTEADATSDDSQNWYIHTIFVILMLNLFHNYVFQSSGNGPMMEELSQFSLQEKSCPLPLIHQK